MTQLIAVLRCDECGDELPPDHVSAVTIDGFGVDVCQDCRHPVDPEQFS